MPEIFQYSFMLRALGAGVLVALVLPVLGSFLVSRRYSLIADSLAHVSLAGVGAGLLLGFTPTYAALPVTIAGALLLEWLRRNGRISGEVSLAILMSSGLAVAVVLAGISNTSNVDFSSYLFGSIATTSTSDLIALACAAAIALGLVIYNYRVLLHVSFSEDSARVSGKRVTFLNYTLVALTAAIVVLGLRIVGGLLIGALLVMPVVAAAQLARSFLQTVLLAVVFALAAVISGLIISFYAGIAAGGAIVLSALVILILALIWRR
jgi:zinc transport system permease protein